MSESSNPGAAERLRLAVEARTRAEIDEVAAVKGISVGATWLVRDVVNLKERRPLVWFQATRGRIPMYRACQTGGRGREVRTEPRPGA